MRLKTSLWLAGILGAINGFLYGGAVEVARQIQNEYDKQELARISAETGMSICTVDMLRWYAIPCLFMLVFSVVSLLVHRLWSNRSDSLTLLWVSIGIISALVVVLPVGIWGWLTDKSFSSQIYLNGLFLFALAATINFLYSVFIQLVAAYHKRSNKIDLP